ncbi:MAG: trypsin-like peptidase domain-containing protein [Eubacterium sp.]|nr:trypsin-like peptidase domain-containing protein [Eubacterium sp.]
MSEFDNNYYNDNNGGYDFQNNDNQDNNRKLNRKERRRLKRAQKKNGNGRRWGTVIASALVFGLVAGTVTYGVNAGATAISSSAGTSASAQTSGTETNNKATLTKTSSTNTSDNTDTSASSSGELSVSEVAAKAMPSMVTISTMSVEEMQSFFGGSQQYQVEGAGTGVIVGITDSEVLIATNNHVIDGASTISVGFVDDSVAEGQIKGTDSDNDLAVVAVQKSDLSSDTLSQINAITIGDSDSVQLGDQVVAIGNALGYGQSVTSGYVSALNRDLSFSDGSTTTESTGLIQTDAAINAGNSGGALLNMKGELIGINEAKSSSSSGEASVDNMGYAIPTAKAQSILEKLMNETTKTTYSDDERGYLGVATADVTSEYAQVYSMPEGVCLTSVPDGSPAADAGLQKGDVITAIDGTSVSTAEDLTTQLKYHKAGDSVTITYQRSDNGSYTEKEAAVTLGSKSDIEKLSSSDGSSSGSGNSGNSSNSSQSSGSGDSGYGYSYGFGLPFSG